MIKSVSLTILLLTRVLAALGADDQVMTVRLAGDLKANPAIGFL